MCMPSVAQQLLGGSGGAVFELISTHAIVPASVDMCAVQSAYVERPLSGVVDERRLMAE